MVATNRLSTNCDTRHSIWKSARHRRRLTSPADIMEEKTLQPPASAFAKIRSSSIEAQLSEDERMIHDTARGYAQEKAPAAGSSTPT